MIVGRFFCRDKHLNKRQLLSLTVRFSITVGIIFLLILICPPAYSEEPVLNSGSGTISDSGSTASESQLSGEPEKTALVEESKIRSLVNTQNQKPIASPDVTASIIKVSVGLLLVIAAIFGSAWFFRRFGNFSPVANDSLKVIGGLTIGQKEKIMLLQVGEEQVLIGVSPGNIQQIHVLSKPIPLNESPTKNVSFSDSLGEALGKWKNK